MATGCHPLPLRPIPPEEAQLSTIATTDKRILIPGVAITVAVLLIGLGFVVFSSGRPASKRGDGSPDATSPARPHIKQARWKFKVERAGTKGRLSKRERARIAAQRPKVTGTLKSAYDAIFLDRGSANGSFVGAARSAFKRSHSGLPRGATRIKTTRRTARVAIDARTARRAAAVVTVVARAQRRGRTFKLLHRSHLWLERGPRGWKIIAFELDQMPVRSRGRSR
jgi:hypothetical protein